MQLFNLSLSPKAFHSASKAPDAEKAKYFKLFFGKRPAAGCPAPGGPHSPLRSERCQSPAPALRRAQLGLLSFVLGLFEFFSPQNNPARPPPPSPQTTGWLPASLRAQPGDPNLPSNQGPAAGGQWQSTAPPGARSLLCPSGGRARPSRHSWPRSAAGTPCGWRVCWTSSRCCRDLLPAGGTAALTASAGAGTRPSRQANRRSVPTSAGLPH